MRMVIEIGSDGIVRVAESQLIAEDGDSQPATVTAQAEPEAAADSSYGETVNLDHSSAEFESRKAELKELGFKWDGKEKVWRKPTDPKTVNDSRKSVRLRVRKVTKIFAIAMLAGMSWIDSIQPCVQLNRLNMFECYLKISNSEIVPQAGKIGASTVRSPVGCRVSGMH